MTVEIKVEYLIAYVCTQNGLVDSFILFSPSQLILKIHVYFTVYQIILKRYRYNIFHLHISNIQIYLIDI